MTAVSAAWCLMMTDRPALFYGAEWCGTRTPGHHDAKSFALMAMITPYSGTLVGYSLVRRAAAVIGISRLRWLRGVG